MKPAPPRISITSKRFRASSDSPVENKKHKKPTITAALPLQEIPDVDKTSAGYLRMCHLEEKVRQRRTLSPLKGLPLTSFPAGKSLFYLFRFSFINNFSEGGDVLDYLNVIPIIVKGDKAEVEQALSQYRRKLQTLERVVKHLSTVMASTQELIESLETVSKAIKSDDPPSADGAADSESSVDTKVDA